MLQIFAPHPDWRQVIWLPNPEWGDVIRLESTMQLKRSMDNNRVVTHVRKIQDSKTFEMNFSLARYKSLELIEFMKIHASEKMKFITDEDEESIRVGYMKINPVDLEKISRGVVGDSKETVHVRLDFESVTN